MRLFSNTGETYSNYKAHEHSDHRYKLIDEEIYYYAEHLKNKIYKIKCDSYQCRAVYHEPTLSEWILPNAQSAYGQESQRERFNTPGIPNPHDRFPIITFDSVERDDMWTWWQI